jgi:hypothetical protein
MSSTSTTEDVVRRYLLALSDPDSLIDPGEIDRLEVEAAKATDPIAKLKAITALEHARTPNQTALKDAFVLHAREWASANDVSTSAFAQMGVPNDVLRSAGLLPSRTGRGRRRVTTTTTRSVSTSAIVDAVSAWSPGTEFVINDVATQIGGSPMTVRKALDELTTSGTVERLGNVSDWVGPGRAPIRYRRSKRRAHA